MGWGLYMYIDARVRARKWIPAPKGYKSGQIWPNFLAFCLGAVPWKV